MTQTRSKATMTYEWPNDDPKYWQALVEYVVEADADRNIPKTFRDFIQDFVIWLREVPDGEDHRVKVLTEEENNFLGNYLYNCLEMEEHELRHADEDEVDEVTKFVDFFGTVVRREWVPVTEGPGT